MHLQAEVSHAEYITFVSGVDHCSNDPGYDS